ncbi:MAG: monofunctional biosynthetic peptidoglycan transglycosylase [Thalassobaculaceae bacterium]|uniref:monofunctional biosynthetic peptidoglycan transglycosylase n=1 Tax=Roseitalea porphyridii TaxID=1852022 RepID=UPI0032EBB002
MRALGAVLVLLILLPVLAILAYRAVPPPGTPLMLARDAPADYRWVDFPDIARVAAQAVIVSEDQTFCAHDGIDWRQMSIVLEELRETGRPSRGASTITMQTARNLFLPPSRTALRKAVEIPLALGLELLLPKRRIVELYLNVVEWGDGIYGIEAAAQHHFGKPASALSRTEAARLAAVLPNPLDRDPARPSAEVGRRAARIAADIVRLGRLFACLDS